MSAIAIRNSDRDAVTFGGISKDLERRIDQAAKCAVERMQAFYVDAWSHELVLIVEQW